MRNFSPGSVATIAVWKSAPMSYANLPLYIAQTKLMQFSRAVLVASS